MFNYEEQKIIYSFGNCKKLCYHLVTDGICAVHTENESETVNALHACMHQLVEV